jgi:alkylated DNA repair dioxygenase AlkB
MQLPLFGATALAPEGFIYHTDFLSSEEEAVLIKTFERLPLAPYKYGAYEGKRRVTNFGGDAPPFPPWLSTLARRAEERFDLSLQSLSTAHLIEYSPGSPIGWHRDMPGFDEVVGISLTSSCRFRLRRKIGAKWERFEIEAEPRSTYLMSGPSRYEWEHSIPPVTNLRYSITLAAALDKKIVK